MDRGGPSLAGPVIEERLAGEAALAARAQGILAFRPDGSGNGIHGDESIFGRGSDLFPALRVEVEIVRDRFRFKDGR